MVATPPPIHMTEILYQAVASPIGVIVATNDVTRLRAKLYTLRRADPLFANIALVPSPTNPSSELWVVKKGELDAQE